MSVEFRYAGIKYNDIVNGEGVCLSFFVQGCPHKCPGCFNPQTWNFNGGTPIDDLEIFVNDEIIDKIIANNVQRNFSVLGGEPLCPENIYLTFYIISKVRQKYPNIKIYVWTGYEIQDIPLNLYSSYILSHIDYLIDGPFIQEERDISLKMRGSRNQKILTKKEIYDIIYKENKKEDKIK